MLVLACLVAVALGAPTLSDTFPRGVPVPAATGWERIDGGGETDGERIAYQLYVNSLRPGLYEITRLRAVSVASGRESAAPAEPEILVWNAHPGQRRPLLCFERVSRRTWWTFWLVKRRRWQGVPPGTARYRHEMQRTIQIYMLHRQNLGLPAPE